MTDEEAITMYNKFIDMQAKDNDELPYTHYIAGEITVTFKALKEVLTARGLEADGLQKIKLPDK